MRVSTLLLSIVLLISAHAFVLYLMGQPLIYSGGYVQLWHGAVISGENSQHFTDWYTFSHVIHGFLFYALLSVLFPRLSIGSRLLLALCMESAWEIFENTDMIINRYREQALAQGYFGDSIINSVGDMCAAAIGFFCAARVPVWLSVVCIISLELLALYFIRDSLTFNIIQLIHPIDAIGAWQVS